MSGPESGRRSATAGLVEAERLGALVRHATEATEAARRGSIEARRRDLATRQRLSASIGEQRQVAGLPRWRALGIAAVAAAALGLFATRPWHHDDALGYQVAGATEVGGYVQAGGAPATLTFSDGSELVLAPGSAGRVSERSAHGANVALEDGVMDVRITHLPGAEWTMHAGPWQVHVIGTAFRLAWDARAKSLRVDLREGKVSVRGPGAEEGVGLRAGQVLDARDDLGIRLTTAGTAAAWSGPAPSDGAGPKVEAAAPSADAPTAVAEAPAAKGSAAEGSAAKLPVEGAAPTGSQEPTVAPARVAWSERVAAGEFDAVLAEADERGIDAVLSSASAADLVALGDAARYRGRGGVASRTLTALRERFGGTAAAANAAFLLGRMADDGGSAASAIRWYDTHMAEGGAFATEALGRKMLAVKRSQGRAAASAVARQYLARHPKGPHAPVARSLVGEGDAASPAQPAGSSGRSPR